MWLKFNCTKWFDERLIALLTIVLIFIWEKFVVKKKSKNWFLAFAEVSVFTWFSFTWYSHRNCIFETFNSEDFFVIFSARFEVISNGLESIPTKLNIKINELKISILTCFTVRV